jgi:two-component system, chemotaxis family, chemotaxis protein CheY
VLEFLRTVRKDETLKDIPFLLATAESDVEYIIEGVKSGVDLYMIKPFNQKVVCDKIRKIAYNREKARLKNLGKKTG